MTYLIIGDPSGKHTLFLMEKRGVSPSDITVWEDSQKGINTAKINGVTVTSDLDTLMGKKFDIVIGNPPYGSAGNLAIKFLNKCGDLSDDVRLVLPISIRKPSSQNKVRLDFVCVEDNDLPEDTFGKTIKAVRQRWVRTNTVRDKVATFSSHSDFTFVDRDNADICLGRIGGGPSGRFYDDWTDRSDTSHYFISASPEVVNNLRSLETKLREVARDNCNGIPTLSKDEVIRTYIEVFGRSKQVTHTTHPDFTFVKKDNSPDMMIFRCGASTGKVRMAGEFDDNKPDHYYIQATPEVVSKLKDISEELISISKEQNGMPGISKHDLISTYISHYG